MSKTTQIKNIWSKTYTEGRLFSPKKNNINKTNHTDVQRIGDQDISQQEKDKMEERNKSNAFKSRRIIV